MQTSRRKIHKILLVICAALASISVGVSAQEVQREILGIHLKLVKTDVHKRLQEIGSFVRDERKSQEVWQVRDPSFSHLLVAFAKDGKLRFVTAVAREDKDAKRVRYDEIGNLEKARQAGDPGIKNFNYEWDLPSQEGHPGMLVFARGRDPTFLTTLSLKRLVDESGEAK